jgi:hypothetical protein
VGVGMTARRVIVGVGLTRRVRVGLIVGRRVRVGVSVGVANTLIRPYKKSRSLIYKVGDI